MSRTVTLGGDRLGSGKKMRVELHGYERSNHNNGFLWRSTMAAGTLVPFLKEIALPGDTWDIDLDCDIKTHPTIGPLFGSYKVQLDVFLCPMRLYNSLLHNNMLGIGLHMDKVKLPMIQLAANANSLANIGSDIDNSQINPSCILSYLGIRGVGFNTDTESYHWRNFQAIPFLAYWEIYKQYYANKQEETGAVIHTVQGTITETITSVNIDSTTIDKFPDENVYVLLSVGTTIELNYSGLTPDPAQIMLNTIEYGWVKLTDIAGSAVYDTTIVTLTVTNSLWNNISVYSWRYITPGDVNNGKPGISTFPLSNIDDMRKAILAYDSEVTPFVINNEANFAPYSLVYAGTSIGAFEWLWSRMCSQEGLALKTYQSDLFNNWIQTEWIDGAEGINQISAIDVSGGLLTMDSLNLAQKVYEMLNRIAVSGGSYTDWLEAVYDHDQRFRAETPMYMGGLSKELVFQEVISNSESSEGAPLGTLAGKGVMSKKHKGGKIVIKCDEPSYIMGIVSLTPRIDYSQGNDWDTHLETLDDLHKPHLDQIGFQELVTEQMAWWDTSWDGVNDVWVQKSAGKQPAWLNYMTNVNKVRGNFAISGNEMFMTLNRRYEFENGTGIKDLTTYIDPSKYNHIFADTAIDAQNFWVQIAVDMTSRRKLSAKLMPNL